LKNKKNRSKLFNTRDPDVEVARTLEDPKRLKYLFQIKKKDHP
jgi:hypothetical protein